MPQTGADSLGGFAGQESTCYVNTCFTLALSRRISRAAFHCPRRRAGHALLDVVVFRLSVVEISSLNIPSSINKDLSFRLLPPRASRRFPPPPHPPACRPVSSAPPSAPRSDHACRAPLPRPATRRARDGSGGALKMRRGRMM